MPKISPRQMVTGAMLAAVALLIPLFFRNWLQIQIPPFTATLGAHIPSMLSIFLGPPVAVMVGLGSALGFLLTLGPVVAARALMHAVFGLAGALMYRVVPRPALVLLAMLPVHALSESLVVLPFGVPLDKALLVVGLGTALHHLVDAGTTLLLLSWLQKIRPGLFPTTGR